MKRVLFSAALCAASVAGASGGSVAGSEGAPARDGAVIFQEDFEDGLNGWEADGADGAAARWQVVEGRGMPRAYATAPTKGLVFTRRKGEADSRNICKTIPVKPGQRLRVTAWILADKLDYTLAPRLVVGIGDEHRLPTWKGAMNYGDKDEIGFDGWHKNVLVTDPVKVGCDRMRICLGLASDSYGTMAYDHVTVEIVESAVLDRFCVTSRSASHGQVAFSVHAYAEGTLRLASCGWTREMVRDGENAELKVNVADFALGTNTVAATLVGTDGKAVETMSMAFVRTPVDPKAASYKTHFDEHQRLVVNGKPVFPIGLTWLYHNDPASFEILKATPFNFVTEYDNSTLTLETMDRFQACGKGVFVSLHSVYGFPKGVPAWPPKGVVDEASATRHVRTLAKRIKDHPAFWGWSAFDEFALRMLPQVQRRYDMLKAFDPEHIIIGGQWETKSVTDYASSAEAIGIDRYPVGSLTATEFEKTHPNMRILADTTREVVKASSGVKPIWQAVQCYSQQDDMPPGKKFDWMRYPNLAECRAGAWFNIAAGANGLCYFSSLGLFNARQQGQPYDDLMTAINEVVRLSPVLLSVDRPPKVGGDGKDLAVRAYLHNGQLYVLACNLTWNKTAFTLPIEGAWRDPVAELGTAAMSVANGENGAAETKLTLDIPPIGVSIVRLTRAR